MKIIYYDGSVLMCNTIEVIGENIIVDDTRIVPLIEVQRIVADDD